MIKNRINIIIFSFIIILYAYLSNPLINKIELSNIFNCLDGCPIDHVYYYLWRYNFFYGLKPFKDFWYPYGGYFYFNSYVFPWVFIEYFFKIFLFSIIIYSIFYILKKSILNFIYFLIFWIICIYIFKLHNFANYRYYIPLACVLYSYVCLIQNNFLSNFFLSILLSVLFFLELNLFLILLPSILFLIIYFYFTNNLPLQKIFFTVALTSLFIILYLFYLYKDHSIINFINFYLDLDYIFIYAALEYNFLLWFKQFSHDNLLILTLIFIFTSALFFLNYSIKQLHRIGSLIFSLFILIFFLCSKQLIRPHMAWEILIINFFSIFIIVFNINNLICVKKVRIFLFFLILFAVIDLIKPFEERLLKHVKIVNNVFEFYNSNKSYQKDNFLDYKNFITVNEDKDSNKSSNQINIKNFENIVANNTNLKLFNPKYLTINGINGEILVNEFYAQIPDFSKNDFYLLGDEIYLYPIFKLKPYKHLTFYNTSVIKDQIELINEIKSRSPKYVIFNKNLYLKETLKASATNGVSSIITNPTIYQYISQNYKFYKTIFSYDILISEKYEHDNLLYWDNIHKKNLDLKFIPSLANYIPDNNSICINKNNRCSYFLNINILKPEQNKKYKILIKNNKSSKEYSVFFNQITKKNMYTIHLNNLWFWKLDSEPDDYTIKIESNLDKFYINSSNYNNFRLY